MCKAFVIYITISTKNLYTKYNQIDEKICYMSPGMPSRQNLDIGPYLHSYTFVRDRMMRSCVCVCVFAMPIVWVHINVPRSKLTGRSNLASVFHDAAFESDPTRSRSSDMSVAFTWRSNAEVDYWIRCSGTRTSRDRVYRKQRRGLNSVLIKSRFTADKT